MKHSHIATPLSNMEEKLPTKILKPTNAKKISISMFVVSLPLLYVSLLHVPPSDLFKDTTFWFLISNSIIVIVAADSGVFSPSDGPTYDPYDEYVRRSRAWGGNSVVHQHPKATENVTVEEENSNEPRHVSDCPVTVNEKESSMIMSTTTTNEIEIGLRESTKFGRSQSVIMAAKKGDVVPRKKSFKRSATEKRSCRVDDSEYWRMSDEELNKRVEDFIRKFNREIRLQAIRT